MKFLIYRAVIILGIKFKEKDQGSVIKLILSMEILIVLWLIYYVTNINYQTREERGNLIVL